MPTVSQTQTGISQFGPNIPSQVDESLNIFGLNLGMKDIVGAGTLQSIADNLPLIEYDPNYGNGNYLKFDSPGLAGYDLKGYMGFEIDLGLNLHYSWDFGSISATATLNAPRVDGTVARNTYALDTSTTSVNAAVQSFAGTEPFNLSLRLGGSDGGVGKITGGILDAGLYKNDAPTGYVYDIGFPVDTVIDEEIIGTGNLLPGQNKVFGTSQLYGEIGVPQLPALTVNAGGTGTAALTGGGQTSGTGADFAAVHVKPISFIPLIGQINSQSFNFITSPLIDAGMSYTFLDLDVSLSAALRQNLSVSVQSVEVKAIAQEYILEDDDGGAGREAADQADGVNDDYVTVDTQTGQLGDTLVFGNFREGTRHDTHIIEDYRVTLRFDTDIDIVLQGGIDLKFLAASFFINPILIDELRFNFGPLFQTGFSFDIAAIDVFDGAFTVTLDLPDVTHTITTQVNVVGTNGNDKKILIDTGTEGTSQRDFNALAGDDVIYGTRFANVIDGGTGNDVLFGSRGTQLDTDHDTLFGGGGWDDLWGVTGNDTLFTGAGGGGIGQDNANGGSGDDTIYAGASRGVLAGGSGNDTIYAELALFGGQTFDGGTAGFDRLRLDARKSALNFTIDFANGDGTIIAAGAVLERTSYSSIERMEFYSGVGTDTLKGSLKDDLLSGGEGSDKLYGNNGRDELFGDGGDDLIYGEADNDDLTGGDGNDELDGGDGHDDIIGGAGDDLIGLHPQFAGAQQYGNDYGNDTIDGADGDDRIRDVRGTNTIDGGTGDDEITSGGNGTAAFGGQGDDTITAGGGTILAFGNEGDDYINAVDGGAHFSADEPLVKLKAFGGEGSDRILVSGKIGLDPVRVWGDQENATYSGFDTLIVANFIAATSSDTPPAYVAPVAVSGPITFLTANGTLSNGTEWRGFEAFDIFGDENAQRIVAGGASDRLNGWAGDDYLDGGRGIDELIGGANNDILVGQLGDHFDGGGGFDVLVLDASLSEALPPGVGVGDLIIRLGEVSQRIVPPPPDQPAAGYAIINERIGSANFGTTIVDLEQLYMTAGGAGDDQIYGAERDDRLVGGGGNNRLFGNAGNDTIIGGRNGDVINGGDGNDTIDDSIGAVGPVSIFFADTLRGDAGNDTIYATNSAVLVEGNGGDDEIEIGESGGVRALDGTLILTTVHGGAGSDYISGSSNAEIIIGGIDVKDDPPPSFTDPDGEIDRGYPLGSYDAADTLFGYGGDDRMYGGFGGDTIDGGAGDDRIWGQSGEDVIDAGIGNDVIDGGSGDDTIDGGDGSDVIQGGLGHDLLRGGPNDTEEVGDQIDGGAGNDRIFGSNSVDLLRGGDGDDQIVGGGSETLGSDRDRIDGGGGADIISATGAALIDGGTGDDQITLGEGAQEVLVRQDRRAATETVIGFDPSQDVLHFDGARLSYAALSITDVRGTGVRVTFTGISNAPNVVLPGITTADLGAGAIIVTSPPIAKNDAIVISANTVAALPGAMLLANDSGDDLFLAGVSNASGLSATLVSGQAVVTTGAANGSFGYTGSNGVSTGEGVVAVTVIATRETPDLINARLFTRGAAANGTFIDLRGGDDRFIGSSATDQVSGGTGKDQIDGLLGDDSLSGGDGNDVLSGGIGTDRMTGGAGADRFVFDAPESAVDRILDFNHRAGDRIDLRAIDADPLLDGDQSFTFIGGSEFSAVGQVRVTQGGTRDAPAWQVEADVDGDHAADLTFLVYASAAPGSGDFML